jgi:hypothetical protein
MVIGTPPNTPHSLPNLRTSLAMLYIWNEDLSSLGWCCWCPQMNPSPTIYIGEVSWESGVPPSNSRESRSPSPLLQALSDTVTSQRSGHNRLWDVTRNQHVEDGLEGPLEWFGRPWLAPLVLPFVFVLPFIWDTARWVPKWVHGDWQ